MLHPLTLVLALFLVSLVSMSAYSETIKDNNLRYGDTPTDMKNGLIRIRRIRLEGDPLFPKYGITEKFLQKRINQVYSHMGKSLSMASINKIADSITLAYREKGLTFNRAFIVPQEIKQSTLTIHILKGVLSEIDLYDNDLYSKEQILRPFNHLIGKVIYEPDVMKTVNNLNKKLGLKLFAYFSTGSKQGESRLNIKVLKEIGHETKILVDNKGTTQTGQNRFLLSHSMNNPFQKSGRLTASMLTTDEEKNIFGGLSYYTPISDRQKLGVSYLQSNFAISGQFSQFGLEGTLSTLSGFFSNSDPIDKSRSMKISQKTTLAYKRSSVSSIEQFSSILDDDTNYFQAELLYQRHYNIGQKDQYIGSLKPTIGYVTVADDADIATSFFTVDASFRFILFNWLDLDMHSNSLSLSAKGKLTGNHLPAPEQFAATGPSVNRGYAPGLFSGDIGLTMTAEQTFNWKVDKIARLDGLLIQASVFLDYSYATLNSSETFDASFSSMGIAVSGHFQNQIKLGSSFGVPLSHSTSNNLEIDPDSLVVYANASISF
ncbi:MAG: hypothetical protein COA99_17470 [Moraxellaceae bacterium]|nr:MAG: hypothetical protein COA99_17470 [Moraxellaceae bacterium]